MDLGVAIGASTDPAVTPNYVDAIVGLAREAADAGLRSAWFGQRFDYDATALAALVGREVPALDVGTSAIPIFGRQPLLLAAGAATAQAATAGRFQLGLALGAKVLVEGPFGVPYERPVAPAKSRPCGETPACRTTGRPWGLRAWTRRRARRSRCGRCARTRWREIAAAKNLSLRELVIDQFERGPFVGTPRQVAEALDDFVQSNGSDGFIIGSHLVPWGLDEFVDKVVPLPQERGSLRAEYTGSTLRDNLGLPLPGRARPAAVAS